MKQLKMKQKDKKGGFFPTSLGPLTASISGNALSGRGVIRAGEGVITTGQSFQWHLIF